MNTVIQDLIDERECVACEHNSKKSHEDPCYGCFESKDKNSFMPTDEDTIITNYTTNA